MRVALIGAGLVIAGLAPVGVWARPITYPGGWHGMVAHDPLQTTAKADYTLTPKWAVGWADTYHQQSHYSTHGINVTRGWRWNYADSQANVYAWGGGGDALVDHGNRASGWGGTSIDWENRRYFASAATTAQKTINGPDYLWQSARLGVAPHIEEAGNVHSWLMLQVDHTPGARQTWSATPLVRQFYGDYLWEAGVSTRGGVLLNLMKIF